MMKKRSMLKGLVVLCGVLVFMSVLPAWCVGQEGGQAMSENKTLDNLQAAYDGESNANAKYLAFAQKAKDEGYMDVYRMFMANAKAEEIHAAGHAKVIQGMGAAPKADVKAPVVKSTKENLEEALKGETYEKDTMYPDFIKQAELDKNPKAVMTFKGARAAEVEHAKYYAQALSDLDGWKDSGKKFMVCAKCGYTTMDFTLLKCPVCAYPRNQFIEFK